MTIGKKIVVETNVVFMQVFKKFRKFFARNEETRTGTEEQVYGKQFVNEIFCSLAMRIFARGTFTFFVCVGIEVFTMALEVYASEAVHCNAEMMF